MMQNTLLLALAIFHCADGKVMPEVVDGEAMGKAMTGEMMMSATSMDTMTMSATSMMSDMSMDCVAEMYSTEGAAKACAAAKGMAPNTAHMMGGMWMPGVSHGAPMSVTSMAAGMDMGGGAHSMDMGTMSMGCGDLTCPSSQAFIDENMAMHSGMAIHFTCDANVDFVRGMVPHHGGAVEMCKILYKHATAVDGELADLCTSITAAQNSEIEFMTGWLERKGAAYSASAGGCGMSATSMMSDMPMDCVAEMYSTEDAAKACAAAKGKTPNTAHMMGGMWMPGATMPVTSMAADMDVGGGAHTMDMGTMDMGCGDLTCPSSQAFIDENMAMHSGMAIHFTCNANVDFARGMIPHHAGAVEMCKILHKHEKAVDGELADLCTSITAAQNSEIAFMKGWLERKGAAHSASAGGCGTGKMADEDMAMPKPVAHNHDGDGVAGHSATSDYYLVGSGRCRGSEGERIRTIGTGKARTVAKCQSMCDAANVFCEQHANAPSCAGGKGRCTGFEFGGRLQCGLKGTIPVKQSNGKSHVQCYAAGATATTTIAQAVATTASYAPTSTTGTTPARPASWAPNSFVSIGAGGCRFGGEDVDGFWNDNFKGSQKTKTFSYSHAPSPRVCGELCDADSRCKAFEFRAEKSYTPELLPSCELQARTVTGASGIGPHVQCYVRATSTTTTLSTTTLSTTTTATSQTSTTHTTTVTPMYCARGSAFYCVVNADYANQPDGVGFPEFQGLTNSEVASLLVDLGTAAIAQLKERLNGFALTVDALAGGNTGNVVFSANYLDFLLTADTDDKMSSVVSTLGTLTTIYNELFNFRLQRD